MNNSYFDIDYQIANTSFGHLFHDVQMSGIFSDSKTFPDCTPKADILAISNKYLEQKTDEKFDLKSFVLQNFELPIIPQNNFQANTKNTLSQHIFNIWPYLTVQKSSIQGTYIPLPKPFVVPGGRFQEVYYWDSFFTSLGLLIHDKFEEVENIIENFAYLINQFGFVPNGNRSYFLSRSQPPFLAPLLEIFAEKKGNEVLIKYLPILLKEYQFWMDGAEELTENNQSIKRVVNINGHILNRNWDNLDSPRPESYKEDLELVEEILLNNSNADTKKIFRDIRAAAESGWDFSSRWFADGQNMKTIETTDILTVDLNCLIYFLELTIGNAQKLAGNITDAELFFTKAKKRKAAILSIFWDENFFYDYNFFKNKLVKNKTLAACFPLYFKIATDEQAKKVSEIIECDFLKYGGLTTSLIASGQQWDWPNGWAPLQWIAFQGFRNYNLEILANKIKTNWLKKVEEIYQSDGKLTEKYDVVNAQKMGGGGEYPNQDGFGWTNGVTLKLLNTDF